MICKIAGIDELVRGFKNNPKTRRKEVISALKYGEIETPLLMNITGHTKESTFLIILVRNRPRMR